MNSASRFVVFLVEGRRYAVRLEEVQRVVAAVELVPLPDAPAVVLGVFNLQGTVVPAIDTRRRLRLPGRDPGISDQFLVVLAAGRLLALVADRVQGIVEMPVEAVSPASDVVPELVGVEGVLRLPDGVVVIHDLARFLSAEDGIRLDAARKRMTTA